MKTHTKRHAERDGEVGDGSLAFLVTKSFDPAALDAELSEQMNWRKHSGLVTEGLPAEASEDSPVTVWVLRGDVDTSVLRSAITQHEVPEDSGDPLEQFRAKAEEGANFTSSEVQQVLRELVLRSLRG